MKKYLFLSLAMLMLAMTSCKYAAQQLAESQKLTMDEEATYKQVEEALGKLDKKWKVYELRVSNEGVPNHCLNTWSNASVYMIDADNQAIRQVIAPEMGTPAPKEADVTYDEVPEFTFTAASAMKQINDCKAMIPKEFKFLNLEYYEMEYSKRYGLRTIIVINVQEVGKESIEANGTKSDVYYALRFEMNSEGKITMEER